MHGGIGPQAEGEAAGGAARHLRRGRGGDRCRRLRERRGGDRRRRQSGLPGVGDDAVVQDLAPRRLEVAGQLAVPGEKRTSS